MDIPNFSKLCQNADTSKYDVSFRVGTEYYEQNIFHLLHSTLWGEVIFGVFQDTLQTFENVQSTWPILCLILYISIIKNSTKDLISTVSVAILILPKMQNLVPKYHVEDVIGPAKQVVYFMFHYSLQGFLIFRCSADFF